MAHVEIIYRCRVDYDFERTCEDTAEASDEVDRRIGELMFVHDECADEVDHFMGSPGCRPYVHIESEQVEMVSRMAAAIEKAVEDCDGVRLV